MKKSMHLLFLVLTVSGMSHAQLAAPDNITTKSGTLTIQPVEHASLVLSWNYKTIYIDPSGDANLYKGLAAPDLILITDIHGDHMDLKTLEGINTSKAKFIVPKAVADKLPESYKKQVVIINNSDQTVQSDFTIEALPMYNLPETDDSRHPKGRGNGYVITIDDKRIYISGDTEDIAEMRALKNIDIAFVCMNLPYTMDVNQAASAVLAFKPKTVYPNHYRGQDGMSDVQLFKKLVNDEDASIDVRLREWYR